MKRRIIDAWPDLALAAVAAFLLAWPTVSEPPPPAHVNLVIQGNRSELPPGQ